SDVIHPVAGFVARNGGTITNCTATGEVTGKDYVGGFVCWNVNGIITYCKATGNVNGYDDVGGFVGQNQDNGKITECKAEGDVTGDINCTGGFVGWNVNGTITGCKAEGNVRGKNFVGGFAGGNADDGTITNCTATGKVTGKDVVGGFVGWNKELGEVSSCIAKGNVTGYIKIGGFAGVNSGLIEYCIAYGSVNVKKRVEEDVAGVIGNGRVLNKKKTAIGAITTMMLAGTVGGVAFGTIGLDKAGSKLRDAWDSVKAFFNEKVMTNSNYKKVIGALIALGIAAIIIIVPISLSKKKHMDVPVGGFVGENDGKIENCTSSGKATVKKVSMNVAVGGFAGINGATGTIINCEAEEDVHASTKLSGKAGGFVGNNNGKVIVSKFSGASVYLSTGSLYKDDCCGGFAGKNDAGGSIDWCDVGQVKVEPMGDGKKIEKRVATIETTHKTKGGGLIGVAGKLSSTTNCTYSARRKSKTGEVGINSCYKKEKLAIVTNCIAK
ncbi:MAG: hypothetical protein K2G97_02730, partial [Oscillospiraceae bacterium]|nr:hypothetical protein [Oscillospiraceae bacterium]